MHVLVDWDRLEYIELNGWFRQKQIELEGVFVAMQEGDRAVASNAPMKTHSHPHWQLGHILEGEAALTIGDSHQVVRAGETYVIPGGETHGFQPKSRIRLLSIYVHPGPDHAEAYRAKNSPLKGGTRS